MRPGTSAASGNSSACAPGGVGTWGCGPTAAILPASSTRTAPSEIGGAVTGCTEPARMRNMMGVRCQVSGAGWSTVDGSVPDTGHPAHGTSPLWRHPERRGVYGTELRRLGARIEPLEAVQLPGAEGGRERAVGHVHFLQNQRVGPRPVDRHGAAVVHVAHEHRPGRRHDATAPGVVHDALLQVVADPE